MIGPRCPECLREFDLLDPHDVDEWLFGHDCEPDDEGGIDEYLDDIPGHDTPDGVGILR